MKLLLEEKVKWQSHPHYNKTNMQEIHTGFCCFLQKIDHIFYWGILKLIIEALLLVKQHLSHFYFIVLGKWGRKGWGRGVASSPQHPSSAEEQYSHICISAKSPNSRPFFFFFLPLTLPESQRQFIAPPSLQLTRKCPASGFRSSPGCPSALGCPSSSRRPCPRGFDVTGWRLVLVRPGFCC